MDVTIYVVITLTSFFERGIKKQKQKTKINCCALITYIKVLNRYRLLLSSNNKDYINLSSNVIIKIRKIHLDF